MMYRIYGVAAVSKPYESIQEWIPYFTSELVEADNPTEAAVKCIEQLREKKKDRMWYWYDSGGRTISAYKSRPDGKTISHNETPIHIPTSSIDKKYMLPQKP